MLPAAIAEALDRADGTLVAGGYHAMSVSTARVRRWLRFRGWAFLDPEERVAPPLGDLDWTAHLVVERSAGIGATLSGTAALGGAALVPPEAALSVVLVVRMVQRLCVVYGFDPETDRGAVAVTRALAAVWRVELPEGGATALRVSDVPRLLRGGARPSDLGASLARAMLRGSLSWASSRISRFVPVVSAPFHARGSRDHLRAAGRAATQVLRRLAEVTDASEFAVEEAVVVR